MKTIKSEFGSYADAIIPQNASDGQIIETQRAFYAGAKTALSIITGEVADLPEMEGIMRIQALIEEVEDFRRSVLNSEA